jgi:hypothetical protein
MECRVFGDNAISLDLSFSVISSIKHFNVMGSLNEHEKKKFETGQSINVSQNGLEVVCMPNLSNAKAISIQKEVPKSSSFPNVESYRSYWKKRVRSLNSIFPT